MAVSNLNTNKQTKSNPLRVCIALKDNASFSLLGEAQAVWYGAAQKVGLSLLKSCNTGCVELGKDQTGISE